MPKRPRHAVDAEPPADETGNASGYAIDRLSPEGRAIFLRAIAAATLKWALAELEREQDGR